MTTDLSNNSMFPTHPLEEGLLSKIKSHPLEEGLLSKVKSHPMEEGLLSKIKFGNGYTTEGCLDKNSAGFGDYRNFNWELETSQDCRREEKEKLPDILDLLPSDPFNMDLSTIFTAITGWIEDWIKDIENDLGINSIGFGTNQVGVETGEDGLFAELNFVWNSAVQFHHEVDYLKSQETSIDRGLLLDSNIKKSMDFSYGKYLASSNAANEVPGCVVTHPDSFGSAPHDALFFSLSYLGVRDLLAVERVCKSFRDTVRNDPLLWRSIHIDPLLSLNITDDALLRLTSRAQGILQQLSLVTCFRITDRGLKHVLETNPGLTKLSVPGCTKLSIEGILSNLKAFKLQGKLGIMKLRLGGVYGMTNKQFEELKILLGADNSRQFSAYKPRFYKGQFFHLSCDDDRAIDIEACPRCLDFRQVYDCPAESCQGKHQSTQLCRACRVCIARCSHCGCCINNDDYEETSFLDLLCFDCWKQLTACQNGQEGMGVHSSKCTIFYQQAKYRVCVCG